MEPSQRENKQQRLFICCFLLAIVILSVDYFTGPLIRLPVFYLVPVMFTTWLTRLRWGLVLAVVMPIVHLTFRKFWDTPFGLLHAAINSFMLIIVFALFAYLINKVVIQKRELEKEIKTLRGILPICSFCKKIRTPDGNWESIESYIKKNSEAEFSHSVCPDCYKTNYPDFL